jgi:Tfp pilus assembly PilM family ATPase
MDHFRILPSGQSAFDYYRLPRIQMEHDAETEEDFCRVLLMGGEERLVGSYRDAVYSSDLNLWGVEPGSVAVLRAIYPSLRREPAVATVIVSLTGTDIFITRHGELQFYRRVDTGAPELTGSRQNFGQGSAAVVRRPLGALVDEEEAVEEAAPIPEVTETFNRQAISLLMTEVQRSVDYYRRECPNEIEEVVVRFAIDSDEASNLYAVMSQHMRSPCELAAPYEYLPKTQETEYALSGPKGNRYIVSVGLALREAAGEYSGAPTLDLGTGDRVVMEHRSAPKALLASAAVSALIMVLAGGGMFWYSGRIKDAEKRLGGAKQALSQVSAEHADMTAKRDRQRLLIGSIKMRDKPVREAMEFIASAVGRRATLTQLSVEENWDVRMTGETLSPRYVADIMDLVNRSRALEPVKLNGISRLDQTNAEHGIRFDLSTSLIRYPLPEQTAAADAAAGAPAKGG